MDLSKLKSPEQIKKMSLPELNELADELRAVLLQKLSRHGGHVGPNLGMVEATIAMHYVFDAPKDKLIFDVSHQSYVHKMLTGRIDAFLDPKKYDDVTGYTNHRESPYDEFTLGHTSTSVALAAGEAKARDLMGEKYRVVALIGDGSLSGGEAFEGMDYAATLGTNFIVIVNDNQMSIAENHGGIYAGLELLRKTNGTAPDNMFKALGFDYRYVEYGNDIRSLIDAMEDIKDTDHPIVLHINTMKGHGWAPAEANKEEFHWSVPFNEKTGAPLQEFTGEDYGTIFSDLMLGLMAEDKKVATITAATPGSFDFTPEKRKAAGSQFIDVAIAEQCGVGVASGMARAGARPVFAVNATFIQRAYDQLSQDVAINGTAPVLVTFYNGIIGLNDVTHLGWFTIPFFINIPEWVVLAPTCKEEYTSMIEWAVKQTEHPVCVLTPGGGVTSCGKHLKADYSDLNKYVTVRKGSKVAIIGCGRMLGLAEQTADTMKADGIDATVINPRFLSGLDKDTLNGLRSEHQLVITLEDGALAGGFGEKIATYYGPSAMRVKSYGIPKEFLDRYDANALQTQLRLRPDLLAADIKALLK